MYIYQINQYEYCAFLVFFTLSFIAFASTPILLVVCLHLYCFGGFLGSPAGCNLATHDNEDCKSKCDLNIGSC